MLLSFHVRGEVVESGQNEKGAEDTCSEVDKRGGCLRGAPYQPGGCPEVLVGETFLCAVNRDKTRKPGGTGPEVVSSLPQPIRRVGLDELLWTLNHGLFTVCCVCVCMYVHLHWETWNRQRSSALKGRAPKPGELCPDGLQGCKETHMQGSMQTLWGLRSEMRDLTHQQGWWKPACLLDFFFNIYLFI